MGIGISKDLLGVIGKYQRRCGGVNSQTLPSVMGKFPVQDGPEGPISSLPKNSDISLDLFKIQFQTSEYGWESTYHRYVHSTDQNAD